MCSQLKNLVIFALLILLWDVDAIKQRRRNHSKRELELGNVGPVVQPGYRAIQPIFELGDEKIVVTKKTLDETDHIRHDIKEAIEENVYVVELDDEDFKEIEDIKNEVKDVDEITVIKTESKTIETEKTKFKKDELKDEKWFIENLKINEGLFKKLVKNIETIFNKFIPDQKFLKTN